MRVTRLYHPEALTCGQTTHLKKDTSNHLIRVLRAKITSPVILFNGDGHDYHCTILDTNTRQTCISVDSKKKVNNESNININLLQGLSRHDRMETSIQKSTELGINKITPVLCQRSNLKLNKEKSVKKNLHWQKVIISACEQSGRNHLPELSEIVLFEHLNSVLDKEALRIVLNPEAEKSLKDIDTKKLIASNHNVEILIGPEGGFNDAEFELLKTLQFINVRFGPRILRTETAGPAVVSAIQLLWGDLG